MIPSILRCPKFDCWEESGLGGADPHGDLGGATGAGYGGEGGDQAAGGPYGYRGPTLNDNPLQSTNFAVDTSSWSGGTKSPEQAGKDYNDLIGQIALGYGKKGFLGGLASGNWGLAAIAGLLGMAYGYSTTPGFTDISGKTGASKGPTGMSANDAGIEGLGGDQIASLINNEQLMRDLADAGYGDLVNHIDTLNQQQETDKLYSDPRYSSYKLATERQYDLARENLFSTLPSGGVLQGSLADLELSKAGTLSDYIAAMQQDVADKQHQVELAKLGGNIQLSTQNAWINAQEKAREEQQQQQMYQTIGYIMSDFFSD